MIATNTRRELRAIVAVAMFAWLLTPVASLAFAQDAGQTASGQTTSDQAASANQDAAAFPKFAEFAAQWDDEAWVPKEARRFVGHIRDQQNDQWKLRMLALREVVAGGKSAVPLLVDRLANGQPHERIFAAQALGYLGSIAPVQPLLDALQNDSDAAVQLYAADALGMRGDAEVAERWAGFAEDIRNRDVRRHMQYAEERAGAAVEQSIIDTLVEWDPETMDTAEVGKPAPDFELTTVNGEKIKLSDFVGKKNVVLVFVYGDT